MNDPLPPELAEPAQPALPTQPPEPFELLLHDKVFECPRFKVNEIVYKNDGEERRTWNIEVAGDLLVIIPRFKQKIILVNELQPPDPEPLWTFPVGFLIPGMPIGETAQSILTDRTGCAAQKFHPLGTFHPSRYISNIVHVMAADGLYRLKDHPASTQNKVAMYTEPEVGALLMNRQIYDGLALASYVFYATSNYFAEVHNGTDNPNNSGEPQ